ncbi:MAG: HNH endonuclease [Janthinobacterium lividum]
MIDRPSSKAEQIDAAWALHRVYPGRRKDDHRCLELRMRLAEAQNWRCCYCGCRMTEERGPAQATFEHIVPRHRGGLDRVENLVIACNDCNSARGHRWWEEHVETVRAVGCGLARWQTGMAAE